MRITATAHGDTTDSREAAHVGGARRSLAAMMNRCTRLDNVARVYAIDEVATWNGETPFAITVNTWNGSSVTFTVDAA